MYNINSLDSGHGYIYTTETEWVVMVPVKTFTNTTLVFTENAQPLGAVGQDIYVI